MSEEVDDLDRALAVVWVSETKGDFMRARQVVLDILAARVASAAAEAWDKGYEASDYEAYHLSTHGRTDNPYRAVLAATHDEGSEQR